MKLGLGLYRHMLTRDNFRFARQAGATHLVVHLVDYFKGQGQLSGHAEAGSSGQPTDAQLSALRSQLSSGWGLAGDPNRLWTTEELVTLCREAGAEGLKIEAIENFDPAHWHDILLDGPRKAEQLENVKTIIRRVGEAGIPILGYNFSLPGVCGRISGPFARGEAVSVGMDGPMDTPMPHGMVWNMVYDAKAPPGTVPANNNRGRSNCNY